MKKKYSRKRSFRKKRIIKSKRGKRKIKRNKSKKRSKKSLLKRGGSWLFPPCFDNKGGGRGPPCCVCTDSGSARAPEPAPEPEPEPEPERNCAICLGAMVNAMPFPNEACPHIYCAECLEGLRAHDPAAATDRHGAGDIRCPQCRRKARDYGQQRAMRIFERYHKMPAGSVNLEEVQDTGRGVPRLDDGLAGWAGRSSRGRMPCYCNKCQAVTKIQARQRGQRGRRLARASAQGSKRSSR